MAAIIGGSIAAIGALGSAAISSSAAGDAASTQANAANSASAATLAMFNTTQANLKPFISAGASAIPELQSLTGTNDGGNPLTAPLTSPFAPTQEQLASTPGYQFTLNQGLQGVQNSYAAAGLGSSGAALKGATNYAEGLAGTQFQQQFQNYLGQNQQIYNMVQGVANQGQNAAVNLGGISTQTGGNLANLSVGAGNALAAGQIGSANALSGGLSAAGQSIATGLLLSNNSPGLSTSFNPNIATTPASMADPLTGLLPGPV